ncbi:enamine deaminase RidA (YjgF/YER057c/UK114 family) [Humitalea rosea]|uniref:Enamine deaminase RidA (YjgF/YER057c/UK114 family) n=1 Tax=Humitalea rosea TaxID=990373 RepID=A0A2W7I2L3_9PROT|nr:RidA family protein [Humitalea rosea]PZW41066.1 enamine deaminase RidA (YjgF/YER057c/UK114 family) [Humitalea rosea]
MTVGFSNPPGVRPPAGGRYSHAARIPAGAERLVMSGQIGITPEGTVPADPAAQIAQAVANLGAVLAGSGLGFADVIKVTVFLTDPALIGLWREARTAAFGDHSPASTLLIVAGLADPAFLVEVEAEAVFPA